MLALLRKPLPLAHLALLSLGVMLAVAIYCLVYTSLAGQPETPGAALGWALVNILPWIPALEGAKRAGTFVGAAAAILAGLGTSLLLGFALGSSPDGVGFEAWRRVPAMLLVAAAAVALQWTGRTRSGAREELPLLPNQIDWVRAAGNYVELRACGRTIVHRASLSAVELQLRSHGFVRIHRSLLVRRNSIARVRPADVVLADGTHLKIGKRYRADLEDLAA